MNSEEDYILITNKTALTIAREALDQVIIRDDEEGVIFHKARKLIYELLEVTFEKMEERENDDRG